MDSKEEINIIQPTSENKQYEKIIAENFFKNNQWLTLFLIFLGVVLVSSGAYFLFNRFYLNPKKTLKHQVTILTKHVSKLTISPAITPNQNIPNQLITFKIPSDWKIYSSANNLFTLNYPPNFVYYENKYSYDFYSKNESSPLQGTLVVFGQPLNYSDIQQYQKTYNILPSKNAVKNSFELFYSFEHENKSIKIRDFITAADSDIDSTNFITFGHNITAQEYRWECASYCISIVLRQNRGVFNFESSSNSYDFKSSSDSIGSETLRQIVSTLKVNK